MLKLIKMLTHKINRLVIESTKLTKKSYFRYGSLITRKKCGKSKRVCFSLDMSRKHSKGNHNK